jgi:hypothetical protein
MTRHLATLSVHGFLQLQWLVCAHIHTHTQPPSAALACGAYSAPHALSSHGPARPLSDVLPPSWEGDTAHTLPCSTTVIEPGLALLSTRHGISPIQPPLLSYGNEQRAACILKAFPVPGCVAAGVPQIAFHSDCGGL